MATRCAHLDHVHAVAPRTPAGCEACVATGGLWVHPRLCLACGRVGCCEQSPSKHATAHFHRDGHPVMRSFEPGEDSGWCHIDGRFLESAPRAAVQRGEGLGGRMT